MCFKHRTLLNVFYIFNSIALITGFALIGVGILYYINIEEVTSITNEGYLNYLSVGCIIIGVLIAIITIAGWYGAVSESKCFLVFYGVLLIIVLLLQIGFGIFAYIEVEDEDLDLENSIVESINKVFRDYYTYVPSRIYLDNLQITLRCCGVTSFEDWQNDEPSSCCGKTSGKCTENEIYKDNCSKALYNYLTDIIHNISYIVLSLVVIELAASIIAFFLQNSIKKIKNHVGSTDQKGRQPESAA